MKREMNTSIRNKSKVADWIHEVDCRIGVTHTSTLIQVLLTVHSHQLERILNGTMLVPPELVVDDNEVYIVNEEFKDFMAQDSALASWLLSTISALLLPQLLGAESAMAVWHTVVQFFANRSTTRS
ncbi:uncharacterized protein LOC120125173 [Hibiscus syriacus]|uniref:uncharacterized protein LOC120125173 n=1 Tax=Hibiscus syriacus TaxID=106335 RepID=UPI00192425AE|nr:uncharacterized protein LOC120125173 [Hibiscus syriacus]